jgi:membrane-associated progesterone receptor component
MRVQGYPMLTFQSAVTYLLALAIPVIYLTYRHYARPQTTQIPAEDSKKPLKSIMQGPRDDLEPPKDNPYTTEALKEFDGSNTSKPIYVAIKGFSSLLSINYPFLSSPSKEPYST